MGEALYVSMEKNIFNPNSVSFSERKKQLDIENENEDEKRKKEKQSPFSRWTQFNLEHTKELMWLALKHPKAHAMLYFLVDQMDQYNAVMCSIQVLQEVLDIGRTTASISIKVLKDNGFISVLKSGTSNIYAINDRVYWKSWGNNLRYSKFPANVVLALSEQDENYQISFDELEHEKMKIVKIKNDGSINENE